MREQKAPNILLCTLGASWAVVPELYGFVAPGRLDLYRDHPRAEDFAAMRRAHALEEPHELWLVTTDNATTRQSLQQIQDWWRQLGEPGKLRMWVARDTDRLDTPEEVRRVRELIFRVALLAKERSRGSQLLLSLAGGRKTMSADLQAAGSILGAHALLHVVGQEPLPEALRQAKAASFTRPLAPKLAETLMPLVIGRGRLDDALEAPDAGQRVESQHFPVELADPLVAWDGPGQPGWLIDEVERRQQQSGRILRNFVVTLSSPDPYPSWTSIVRLPPGLVDAFRRTAVGSEHRELFEKLPKIDLHRHLGGCLDLEAQRKVAQAIADAAQPKEREAAREALRGLLSAPAPWPQDWETILQRPKPDRLATLQDGEWRALLAATLLLEVEPERLDAALYGIGEPRIQLARRHAQRFRAYERRGALSGSTVLGHPAALEPYVEAILAQAREDRLLALELRGSPQKYRPERPVQFVKELRDALQKAGAAVDEAGSQEEGQGRLRVGFVWIVDRRSPETGPKVIEAAVEAHAQFPGFVLGVDLAGEESASSPQNWRPIFEPLFEQCIPITVHAGEGESAQNIWEAAYRLHADRIGHGLNLHEVPALMRKFRERGVCLELCPTANLQIVGFRHPDYEESEGLPAYPLRTFVREGVAVALCTDNPGLSRTTLSNEFLQAARMTPEGLTLWEALGLLRQAFVRSFLPQAERAQLLQRADREIGELLEKAFRSDR